MVVLSVVLVVAALFDPHLRLAMGSVLYAAVYLALLALVGVAVLVEVI